MSRFDTVAARFRAGWAARLIDSCVIERATGESLNTTTGTRTVTWGTTVYSGACLVRSEQLTEGPAGERRLARGRYLVRIPYDQTGPRADDRVTVTSVTDPALDGRAFIVVNVRADTYNTVRILECEEHRDG